MPIKTVLHPCCWLVVSLTMLTSGCNRYLVATPKLLWNQDPQQVFASSSNEHRSPTAQILYATDRALVKVNDQSPVYGHGRSGSLAFGVAQVSLSPNPSWQELIRESTLPRRGQEFALTMTGVREVGHLRSNRFDPTAPIAQTAGTEPVVPTTGFHDLLRDRLAQTSTKDVYIFIHGYNNTFDDAVFRAAEVWHFLGRTGVPIAYTWPAGLGGIRGYAYDRESGEFTVSHLREFVKNVASCPEVERIHLVAHSRGADVTISALRELNLHFRAQNKSTRVELKLENLVLAAPDVDEDVFIQRCVAENLLQAAGRTTIYVSEHDCVIEAADVIFASRRRLGAIGVRNVNPKMRQKLAKLPNVQLIECKVSGWTLTHSYVFTHPAALSDLILLLRDSRPPGIENGRPLRQPAPGLWELTDDYLN